MTLKLGLLKSLFEAKYLILLIINRKVHYNIETARVEFIKIDLHPNYGETYFERGKVYLLMNNIEAACADFQKAIALHFQFDREVIPKQCK